MVGAALLRDQRTAGYTRYIRDTDTRVGWPHGLERGQTEGARETPRIREGRQGCDSLATVGALNRAPKTLIPPTPSRKSGIFPPATQGLFPTRHNKILGRNKESSDRCCHRASVLEIPWEQALGAPGHCGRGSIHSLIGGAGGLALPTGDTSPRSLDREEGSYKSRRRSSQVSTGHFEAPPNTSTLLSTQGMMLPGMFVEQLAMLTISCARRTRSHMLNWLSSPTNACVASNLPPTVSWEGGEQNHIGTGSESKRAR